jgi:hypothetical protein
VSNLEYLTWLLTVTSGNAAVGTALPRGSVLSMFLHGAGTILTFVMYRRCVRGSEHHSYVSLQISFTSTMLSSFHRDQSNFFLIFGFSHGVWMRFADDVS